ncbi:MAG: hypothetical protein ACE5G9_10650 [Nitrospinales bacterium]
MQPNAKVLLEHFEWNIRRLREILQREKTPYYRDAALQRFGFAFDQALKSIGAFAARQNRECHSAQQCFELAVNAGWLEATTDWQAAARDYEQIQGHPSGETADSIHSRLENYCSLFEELHRALSRPD